MSRQVDSTIPTMGRKKGIISNRVYDGELILEPQEADLLQ